MRATAPDTPLTADYDGLVCDLDGVVYRGGEAVPGAPESLQALVSRHIRLVYATNNASRVPAEVVDQLSALGAPATADDVVTSAQAGAARLAERLPAGVRVLALGGPGVAEALTDAGLVPVLPAAVAFDDGSASANRQAGGDVPAREVAAVLQGLGRKVSVADFEIAARLLADDGLVWVGTNDDATLPLPWGQAPGNGAYLDLLASAAGRRPDVVGKPHPPLYRLALARLGTSAARTLAVGDRLGTDVAGAQAAGLDSAWVLTGVDGPVELLATDCSPTYVLASLRELLLPYAVPQPHAGGWRCGGAEAAYDDGELSVRQGSPNAVETVRAGLAALVEARDAGAPTARLQRAARALDHSLEQALTDEHDVHEGESERTG
ncbi:HAD-IIA family hydrolase [Terrabacter sp. NPDC080008]|uniref:HAD-IIA family hydrolase n=1 Tax=Terrabacter sp. NPDC080008 TaxID=3155176 RepID=UPI00344D31EC